MDGANRNGVTILPTMLTTHGPLDLIVVMLGANDMKPWIAGRAIASKQGMERLVEIVRGHAYPMDAPAHRRSSSSGRRRCPRLPIPTLPTCSMAASRRRASWRSALRGARRRGGCGFFDAGSVSETTPLDGVHLDAENTRAIGRALAPVVRVMLQL